MHSAFFSAHTIFAAKIKRPSHVKLMLANISLMFEGCLRLLTQVDNQQFIGKLNKEWLFLFSILFSSCAFVLLIQWRPQSWLLDLSYFGVQFFPAIFIFLQLCKTTKNTNNSKNKKGDKTKIKQEQIRNGLMLLSLKFLCCAGMSNRYLSELVCAL